MKRYFLAALTTILLSACHNPLTHFQEGNVLEPQAIAGIHVGMSKEEVAKQMGTPVYENLFRKNRWIYIHHVRRGGHERVENMYLDFANNRLAHISKKP